MVLYKYDYRTNTGRQYTLTPNHVNIGGVLLTTVASDHVYIYQLYSELAV